jgi:hypothetical protein
MAPQGVGFRLVSVVVFFSGGPREGQTETVADELDESAPMHFDDPISGRVQYRPDNPVRYAQTHAGRARILRFVTE